MNRIYINLKVVDGKSDIFYRFFLALKFKFCNVINKNGVLSLEEKTTFRGNDHNMMGLNLKKILDLENAETISRKLKLNWKRGLHGVKIPHRVFQCLKCNNNKICNQCESKPRTICFDCELVKSCEHCIRKKPKLKKLLN